MLLPNETDEKTGKLVSDVLKDKHPNARVPEVSSLPTYPTTPELRNIDITANHIETVAQRLSGSGGPSGTSSSTLQSWLLKFGSASAELRNATAELVDWLANHQPPWAAYRALMAGRLVALDKCPGVRPVGIGETWRRLFAKTILLLCGKDAKQACGINQLCAGLESGIEGAVHDINVEWKEPEENYGFLLVDASNAFNEINRTIMLWVVRHEWPLFPSATNTTCRWSLEATTVQAVLSPVKKESPKGTPSR